MERKRTINLHQRVVMRFFMSALFVFAFASISFATDAIKMKEFIIRTPSLSPHYWSGTYEDHVDHIVSNASSLGMEVISLIVRSVDDDVDKGAMMYASTLPNTHSYNGGYGAWGDDRITYFVNKIHAAGMEAHAWFPVFNDADLYDAFPAYRTIPDLHEANGKFCTPADTNVRKRQLALIKEFMIDKGFGFDGIRLDFLRYQDEQQPRGPVAVSLYNDLYGKSLDQVIGDRHGNRPNWEEYLLWRAELLSSFAGEVKDLLGSGKRLGAYLMPHSGVSDEGYLTLPNYPSCWSGIDFEMYEQYSMDIIPMVYWTDFEIPDYTPSQKWDWVDASMRNTKSFVEPRSEYIPCFSLSYPNDEWMEGITRMRNNDLTDITVFYWAGGGYTQDLFDRLATITTDANRNVAVTTQDAESAERVESVRVSQNADGTLKIAYAVPHAAKVVCSLASLTGDEISPLFSTTVQAGQQSNTVALSNAIRGTGLYLVTVTADGSVVGTAKILIQ